MTIRDRLVILVVLAVGAVVAAWMLVVSPKRDQAASLATQITAEQSQLDSARSHIRGSMALGLEDSGARMSRIGHSQLVHGRVLTMEELDQRLEALTLEQVNEVAARRLSGPRTVVSVGPAG